MTKKEKQQVAEICRILNETYGTDYKCYLNHENAWQLLIATMLSAQCTDARVNIVTKDLFVKYPTLQAFADADIKELEKDIYSTGFYKNKAKNIIGCAKKLISEYGGEVPSDIESLTKLDGVGRKTANVIRGHIGWLWTALHSRKSTKGHSDACVMLNNNSTDRRVMQGVFSVFYKKIAYFLFIRPSECCSGSPCPSG